ncbi:MAG TPA: hypothetical protein VIC54_10085 [Terriglobales bacterium]|jgi:hypothetical protein
MMTHPSRFVWRAARQPLMALVASSLMLANLAAAPPSTPATPAPSAAAPLMAPAYVPLSAAQLRKVSFAHPAPAPAATPIWTAAAFVPGALPAAPAQESGPSNHRIGKAALVFGILGTLGVVGGVVALRQSKTNSACLSGDASTACNDIHKAAKIEIPASAVVAGLGYFFAFHHRF